MGDKIWQSESEIACTKTLYILVTWAIHSYIINSITEWKHGKKLKKKKIKYIVQNIRKHTFYKVKISSHTSHTITEWKHGQKVTHKKSNMFRRCTFYKVKIQAKAISDFFFRLTKRLIVILLALRQRWSV